MKRLALALLLLTGPALAASPAVAKDITVTMDEQAWAANIQLLDAATKAQGLAVAQAALFIKEKIEAAAKASQAAAEPKKEDPK